MVYCAKCGHKNADDAKACSQCGSQLYPNPPEEPWQRRRPEEECFGLPRGGTIVMLFFGIVIVLFGVSSVLSEIYGWSIPWWPLVVIMFGGLMILAALYGLFRRR